MIDGQNFFERQVKSDKRIYNTTQKIATFQGDDCTICCLLDFFSFKEHYKMMAKNLSKQQAFDDDPKAMQQSSFIGNLAPDGNINTAMFLFTEKVKETILEFLQGTVAALYI